MAKPDLDDGWFKLSHELDAALAVADWTKAARVVLRVVFSQIYGPAKRRTAMLSSTRIAHDLKKPKQWIDRGIRELVTGHALQKTDGGEYRFLKDYEKWKDQKGRDRLSLSDVAWVQKSVADTKSYKYASVINPGDNESSIQVTMSNPGDNESSIEVTEVINPGDRLSPGLMTDSDEKPCRETTSDPPKNKERRKKKEEERTLQKSSTPENEDAQTTLHIKGPTGSRSREAYNLEAKYDEYGFMPAPGGRGFVEMSYGEWARLQCDDYDPKFVDRVLDYFLRRLGQKHHARYLLAVLDGGPGNFRGSTAPQRKPEPPRPRTATDEYFQAPSTFRGLRSS